MVWAGNTKRGGDGRESIKGGLFKGRKQDQDAVEKTEDGFSEDLWISSGVMRVPTCSRGQQFVHVFVCLYEYFGETHFRRENDGSEVFFF